MGFNECPPLARNCRATRFDRCLLSRKEQIKPRSLPLAVDDPTRIFPNPSKVPMQLIRRQHLGG
jgi:hypothetical protein